MIARLLIVSSGFLGSVFRLSSFPFFQQRNNEEPNILGVAPTNKNFDCVPISELGQNSRNEKYIQTSFGD